MPPASSRFAGADGAPTPRRWANPGVTTPLSRRAAVSTRPFPRLGKSYPPGRSDVEDTCWSRRFNISRSPAEGEVLSPRIRRGAGNTELMYRRAYSAGFTQRRIGRIGLLIPGKRDGAGGGGSTGGGANPLASRKRVGRSVAKCDLERPPLLPANHRSGGRPSTVRSARSRRAPRSLSPPEGAARPRRHLRAAASRARRPRRGFRAVHRPSRRPRRRFRGLHSRSRRPWRRFEPGVGFRAARKPAAATGVAPSRPEARARRRHPLGRRASRFAHAGAEPGRGARALGARIPRRGRRADARGHREAPPPLGPRASLPAPDPQGERPAPSAQAGNRAAPPERARQASR